MERSVFLPGFWELLGVASVRSGAANIRLLRAAGIAVAASETATNLRRERISPENVCGGIRVTPLEMIPKGGRPALDQMHSFKFPPLAVGARRVCSRVKIFEGANTARRMQKEIGRLRFA